MRIIIAQNEISEAINNIIAKHIVIKNNQEVSIKVKSSKTNKEFIAEIDIIDNENDNENDNHITKVKSLFSNMMTMN